MDLLEKLARLCGALNRAEVKYVVVGGCAIILHGYYRTTHDIDLLLEPSAENVDKLRNALYELFRSEDAFDIHDDDLAQYAVVRFVPESEEIVIDLIGRIGDVSFDTTVEDTERVELEGASIPLCGLGTLIETKKGIRPKDRDDLLFLLGKKEYLDNAGKS